MREDELENGYRIYYMSNMLIGTLSDILELDEVIEDPYRIRRHAAHGAFCLLRHKQGVNSPGNVPTYNYLRPFLVRHRMTPRQAIVILKEGFNIGYAVGDKRALEVIDLLEDLDKTGWSPPSLQPEVKETFRSQHPQLPTKFQDLFIGSREDQLFVESAMKMLKITDSTGKFILEQRQRSRLLGFIHALVERFICPHYSDEVLMKLFTSYTGTYYKKLNANQSNAYRDGYEQTLSYLKSNHR